MKAFIYSAWYPVVGYTRFESGNVAVLLANGDSYIVGPDEFIVN